MRKDKNLAQQLRQQHKSYNEISKILNVPKSTLSAWFKDDPKSQKIKSKLTAPSNPEVAKRISKLVATNKEKWRQWRELAKQEARKEFKNLFKNPVFIAGLMLYWSEGDNKPGNPFRLTNTSPKMISLYIKFLIQILKIPKNNLRIGLILYPDLSEEKSKNFWARTCNLPLNQFYKTQFIKGRHPSKRLSNGICMVIYNSRQLKEKVLVWIDLISNQLYNNTNAGVV